MIDNEVALEALSVLCNTNVTSVQKQRLKSWPVLRWFSSGLRSNLSVQQLIPTILDAEQTHQASKPAINCSHDEFRRLAAVDSPPFELQEVVVPDEKTGKICIDEDEFFDPQYNFDFTNTTDTKTYYRGGEVYERPCGWSRFALKVLDKYPDGNSWLGKLRPSTDSVAGEWPVSYHGTSAAGAGWIIAENYKPGVNDSYGRGIYSTPFIAEARVYSKTFISKKTGKRYRVVLQNRVNPEYRKKFKNDKYWLVPIEIGTSPEEVQKMVERAIRPYALLLKEETHLAHDW